MNLNSRIYVAGHRGLVGSAIFRQLKNMGYRNVIHRTHRELPLDDQESVKEFFEKERPEYVFLAAAKVGGIIGNMKYPAEFIYTNLQIQTNVIDSCHIYNTKKLLFLGSSCIYPRKTTQPINEKYLMTGELEQTNVAYATAKIAGITMAQAYNKQYGTNFISVMPCNLYGLNDNYNLETSHVLPALIRKFHDAKVENQVSVTLFGTGEPKREFLYSDDLADACIFLMNNYNDSEIINVGTGNDIKIRELAEIIKEIVGFNGDIHWDTTKPDGTPRKVLDIKKISDLGWSPKTNLKDGIKRQYDDFLTQVMPIK